MTSLQLKNSSWQVRLPIFMGFLLWSGVHVWVLTYYYNQPGEVAAWDSFVYNVLILGAITLLYNVLPKFPKAGGIQSALAICLVLTFIIPWTADQILVQLMPSLAGSTFLSQAYPIRLALIFLFIFGAALSITLYQRLREANESKTINQDISLMAKEAELQKLQQQLQPHFLFNSLNSINALILIEPDQARVMVQQLSDFLRATLVRSDEKWITLKDELDYLDLYLSIEKVRFGHRLKVEIDADDQIKLWLIPPLLIQPLVENAIKFGLYGTTETVSIIMKTKRVENSLQIEITNPFDQDMLPPSGSGFGLNGLRRRLYLLYAQNDLLTTSIRENFFTVQLTLPEKL